jgi:hypothetical protein
MSDITEDPDFPDLSAEEVRNETWHDIVLRTRRAELVAGRANANAIAAVGEMQSTTAKVMTREEYQRRVDEWMALRRRERQHSRVLLAITSLCVLGVFGLGFSGLQSSNDERAHLGSRVAVIEQVFANSCRARNAQLDAQNELYRSMLSIEQNATDVDPARAERVAAYTDALGGLPQPVDCEQLLRGLR